MHNIDFSSLARRLPIWLNGRGPQAGVALCSRVRLARNLAGQVFPAAANSQQSARVLRKAVSVFRKIPALENAAFAKVADIGEIDRQVLVERRLASRELFSKPAAAGILVAADETVSVMVNEEDHLRIQAMAPGFQLDLALARAARVDAELLPLLPPAYSDDYGYLTSCPTNAGTGLRASVMLQLIGLALCKEMDAVIRAAEALGLAVRGVGGEGSQFAGGIFQISNQCTLGTSVPDIIARLKRLIAEIIRQEENARRRLLFQAPEKIFDFVGHGFGRLRYAGILKSEEALNLLAALRFGIALGAFSSLGQDLVAKLILIAQPGHMQKLAGRELEPAARDVARAAELRRQLATLNSKKTGRP